MSDCPQTSCVRMMWTFTVALMAASCSASQAPVSNAELTAPTASPGSVQTTVAVAADVNESEGPAVGESSESQTATTTPSTSEPTNLNAGYSCRRLPESEEQPWVVVNDGVMGGRSQGVMTTEADQMQFSGNIVTDGGGFSSVRRLLDGGLDESDRLQMRVRTDEREYEVLLTDIDSQAYRVTYYAPLITEGEGWQVVDVSFDELEARIFGRRVDAPPFQPEKVTTIGIILADGADGEFLFELDWISACPSTLS